MSYLSILPDTVLAATGDLTELSTRLDFAAVVVRSSVTDIETLAQDDVSSAISTVFNDYGSWFVSSMSNASELGREFAKTLASSHLSYFSTEATVTATLASERPGNITLIMGGTGLPTPFPTYLRSMLDNFVTPNFPEFGMSSILGLYTPEQLFPVTGLFTETLNTSVGQGLSILNTEIMKQLSVGNNLTVVGYSQSAIIASLEMRHLQDMVNPPLSSQLNFVLLGNPMAPNGGIAERLIGLDLGPLGINLEGSTPVNTIYHTDIYSEEYDTYADFPQYPVDVLSDLNAIAGAIYAHTLYPVISPLQVAGAIQLPTDPSYGTNIDYFILPAQNLPLLDPLLQVPIIGKPLVDLIQPDLRYLINWGFGNPYYGYSTGYANIPTTAGILPPLSDTLALPGALISGTQQGLTAFAMDVTQGLYGIPPAINAFAQQLPTYLNGFQNAVTGFTQTLPTDVSALTQTLPTDVSALTQTPIYPGTQTLP